MAGASIGATAVAKVAIGATEVLKVSVGDAVVWQAVTFVPSGMTKAGAQALTTSWALLTGWTPDAGSTVVSNALQVNGAKATATISVSLPYSGSFSYPRTARLLLNGVVIATSPSNSAASGTLSFSATGVDVRDGDDVTVEVMIGNFANGSISAGGTVTIS